MGRWIVVVVRKGLCVLRGLCERCGHGRGCENENENASDHDCAHEHVAFASLAEQLPLLPPSQVFASLQHEPLSNSLPLPAYMRVEVA